MSSAAGGAGGGGGGARQCDHCGKEGNVKICSKCHTATYCGAECQKEAWGEHKKVCRQRAEKYARERS